MVGEQSKAKGDTPTCRNRNELLGAASSSEGGSALIHGNLSISTILRASHLSVKR